MNELVDAVAALNPKPRGSRWASLSSCLVDAVWSIGVNYDAVTVPTTRAVFTACTGDDTDPLVAPDDLTTPDPVQLDAFLTRFPDVDALLAVEPAPHITPRRHPQGRRRPAARHRPPRGRSPHQTRRARGHERRPPLHRRH